MSKDEAKEAEFDCGDAAQCIYEAFLGDVLADWRLNGSAAIASVRAERPHDYLKLVASLFPKEQDVRTNALESLSNDQLAARLSEVLARLARGGAAAGWRDGEAPASQSA
jgi:hypothetical protein